MDRTSVLIARSQAGESEAREVLIESNLGLVRHIVRRFAGRGHDLEDLFQIGVIGLMKAIDKFNLELGLKFSTYAVPMITGEIKRFLRDDGPVKVSRTIKENGLKVRLARQRLQADMGREPTVEELAEAAGLSVEDVVLAMEALWYRLPVRQNKVPARVLSGGHGSVASDQRSHILWHNRGDRTARRGEPARI